MKRYRRRHRDDDDAFDEGGILKDGRSYRVPLQMCDHDSLSQLQQAVARASMRVTDGQGGTILSDGLETGLHRPGWRLAVADHKIDPKKGRERTRQEEEEERETIPRETSDDAMRARDQAYQDYDERIRTEYLHPVGLWAKHGGDHD